MAVASVTAGDEETLVASLGEIGDGFYDLVVQALEGSRR
jgi:hypothetical protein